MTKHREYPLGYGSRAMPSARAAAASRWSLLRVSSIAGIAIALGGCDQPPRTGELSILGEGAEQIWIVRDDRTGCEYLWTTGGGLELRIDPRGNVTPQCVASGMSALGQDPAEGLEAKPASPTVEDGDAQ